MATLLPQFLDRKIFKIVGEVAAEHGVRAFVIGGYVRDCFLSRKCDDIDIVVEGSGIDFARAVGERTGKYVSYFKNFGTAMLHFEGAEIEFVGARKESYRRESRKPIVENGTLEDDQLRRDFTINALALSLQPDSFGELVDPFGGVRDLCSGIIRTPLDPDTTYSDDPLRMLRAVRFASKLSTPELTFTIVPESMESMRRMADRLKILSMERITEELNKMLMTPRPSMAFRLMDEAGLLPYILPELCALKGVETVEGRGHKDNFEHTLAVLDNVSNSSACAAFDGGSAPITPPGGLSAAVSPASLWLRWAALLHDVGKPASKRYEKGAGWTFHGHEIIGSKMVPGIFNRLKLPIDSGKYVRKLVWLHLRPIALVDDGVTDSAVRRLLFDAGDDIDDLMTLCNADITSKNEAKVARIKANFELVKQKLVEVEAKDAIRNFKNPITGEYVMQLYGIPPCKAIGALKEMVKEAILDGEIGNNFEEADAYMRAHAAEFGLQEK
ncbi:MAG: CCA tRNA nucleotidyltransferase [Bacteroidales bacterium]|nr:CCA tRNA nucleotidyltransferase [Bacteroidales bacterium]